MDTLNNPSKRLIAISLVILMLATRLPYFQAMSHMADASWAVFLIGGFYLRKTTFLAGFIALAAMIDYLAVTRFGVSDFCITPAYGFLLPSYAALWLGGYWAARNFQYHWRGAVMVATAFVSAISICFVISNASFFLFSENIGSIKLVEYAYSVSPYFLGYLETAFVYAAITAVIHAVFHMINSKADQSHAENHL